MLLFECSDILILGLISIYIHLFSVQKVQEEGKHAIDSPGAPSQIDIPPEDYALRKCRF